MQKSISNNKRIAKNTFLLYFRMLFLMLISLYTSRVILNALGVEDYGIYNVVGGVVTMFSILSGSLSAAISRFITYELGAGNKEKLNKVFSSSVTIQVGIAIIIIILAETIGLWFLNQKMVIPENRMSAANWCFQFSIITFAIKLISLPYNAAIIAHEKMSTFAYISILEALGKLMIAWFIVINPIDRLVFFAGMITVLAIIVRLIYGFYCKKHFEECTYKFVYDHGLLKRMFSFAGWNFFGAGSWQLMTQGVNLLLNVYWGVSVNAARGIANKIDSVVLQFVNNFTTAVNPQITKSYAANDKKYMFGLMLRGAKFSYFLMLFFAIPIMIETDYILHLWLGIVPNHTVMFVRLALIVSMTHVLSNTMITAMLATGNIKKYQIIVGGLGMLIFPIAWLFLYLGLQPESVYFATLIVFACQLFCRLKLMKEMIGFPIVQYLQEVLLKVIEVTILASIIPVILSKYIEYGFIRLIIITVLGIICCVSCVWFIGLNNNEKRFAIISLKNVIRKVRK